MSEKKSLKEFERLSARRRRRRRALHIVFFLLALALVASFIWLTHQPQVRISNIEIIGGDPAFADIAKNAMAGNYLGLIPHDSIFFVPEHAIRREIFVDHPNIAAISISRIGFTGITIKIIERTPVARWCGLIRTESAPGYCYLFDSSGFIYMPVDVASTTQPLNSFTLYAPLAKEAQEPLRATLRDAQTLPAVFDFARQMGSLGSNTVSITIRDDEVDYLLQSGTRITYVHGEEEKAFAALMSSKQNLNLSDGSLEYVDVRFDGKVYLKKRAVEEVQI